MWWHFQKHCSSPLDARQKSEITVVLPFRDAEELQNHSIPNSRAIGD